MESRNRIVEMVAKELLVSEDEMPTAEAVVAVYQSELSAALLHAQAVVEDGVYVFDMNHQGYMILNGLRQARAGRAAGIDNVFELSDEQREQATRMLEEYESQA
jgi:hypothetical protein